MKTAARNNSIHHRQEIKVHLHQLVAQLRDEVGQATAAKPQSGFETSAEGRAGLVHAYDDYEEQSEAAWRSEPATHRPNQNTTHAPRR